MAKKIIAAGRIKNKNEMQGSTTGSVFADGTEFDTQHAALTLERLQTKAVRAQRRGDAENMSRVSTIRKRSKELDYMGISGNLKDDYIKNDPIIQARVGMAQKAIIESKIAGNAAYNEHTIHAQTGISRTQNEYGRPYTTGIPAEYPKTLVTKVTRTDHFNTGQSEGK